MRVYSCFIAAFLTQLSVAKADCYALATALMAANFASAEKEIQSGVDINCVDGSEPLILWVAAGLPLQGDLQSFEWMIARGVDVNARGASNRTVLAFLEDSPADIKNDRHLQAIELLKRAGATR